MDTKVFSGSVKIRPKGHTEGLWTVRSAIQDTQPQIPSAPQSPKPKVKETPPSVGDLFIKVIDEDVQAYEEPDMNSKLVTTIPKGTFLVSTERLVIWCRVKTSSGPCWVKKSHIKIME